MENLEDGFFDIYKKLIEDISNNTDHREKQVGDKVKIWDGSGNVDNKGKHRYGIDPLFKNFGIVSEVGCNKLYKDRISGSEYTLDLQVYFPDQDIYVWTCSEFAQLSDFQ